MTADHMVNDLFLRSALTAISETRDQTIKLLEVSEQISATQDSQLTAYIGATLSQEQKRLGAGLARLRGLNRTAVHNVRQTKQETAEGRAEIDTLHLQLQNLYYEQRHLKGEIDACEGYQHKHQSLPLESLEDFLDSHPDLRGADESTLMVARINHEYSEREALEHQRQGLLKKKQSLIAENKKRKDDLASLDQDLEKFIDAAKPIQKIFDKEY